MSNVQAAPQPIHLPSRTVTASVYGSRLRRHDQGHGRNDGWQPVPHGDPRAGRLLAAATRPPRRARGVLRARGRARLVCGTERYRAAAGAFAFLPSGIAHTFRVIEEARVLTIAVPGGIEGFFRGLSRPADGPGLPLPSAPDVAAVKQIGARYNTELVGPPLGPRVSRLSGLASHVVSSRDGRATALRDRPSWPPHWELGPEEAAEPVGLVADPGEP